MAFNYSNNKNSKPYEPNIYSVYRFNNGESSVDKTCLTLNTKLQMAKITIAPRKEGTGDEVSFDMDKGLSVYLNHSKARIFAGELRNFLRDPDTYNGAGVPSGAGIISISNGKEFGVNTPVLVIRKLDESGDVISSFAYEFKTDFYYAVHGYTGSKSFTKDTETYKYLEIEAMITFLEEYYKAMTYTLAYSVLDANAYNHDRLQKTLNSVAEKLGIETNRSSNRGSGFNSSTSFFNNASGNSSGESYTPATLDDID